MNSMHTLIVVLQVLSALAIIGLVLLQHGKGADMGASFGSGASGSLFGASGSSNFLSKMTALAAVVFFSATLGLAFVSNAPVQVNGGVMENVPVSDVPGAAPVAPAPSSAPGEKSTAPVGNDRANEVPK